MPFRIAVAIIIMFYMPEVDASMARLGGYSFYIKRDGPSKEQEKNKQFEEGGDDGQLYPAVDADSKARAGLSGISSYTGVVYSAEEKYTLPPLQSETEEQIKKSLNKETVEKKISPEFTDPSIGLNIIETGNPIWKRRDF
jgi:hypothetical protein